VFVYFNNDGGGNAGIGYVVTGRFQPLSLAHV
jgi:hypothetical protein